MYGKLFRLNRLLHQPSKKICIVPMDHGITYGPIEGIREYITVIRQVFEGGADAVILHKGLLKIVSQHEELLSGRYIMHLSASTNLSPDPSYKSLIGTVEEAVKYGAEGISIHINLGSAMESQMLLDFGKIASACQEWGMPLLAMMYLTANTNQINHIIHAARVAEELGADMVKLSLPGNLEDVKKLIHSVKIPVLLAGGSRISNQYEFLKMINHSLMLGISGVAIGRNIFQNQNPKRMASVISRLVHGNINLNEALIDLNYFEANAVLR